ncbi:MAG: DNA translocase FtsK 4TM domain-containing protein [Chitinophagales bacterium]|nr:DNA translocase FtsK [Chitinophagales bacterium]MDW8392915.1 DNA translocase FtsK 4TM domain-containing protein [Chitinophagales bacterium]
MPRQTPDSDDAAAANGKTARSGSRKRKDKKGAAAWWPLRVPERIQRLTGLTLLLFSVFLLLASVSYLFTWQEDQDKVFRFRWHDFLLGRFEVANHLGRLGAYASHFFFYNGFGISTFLLVLLAGGIGANLALQKKIFHITRLATLTLLGLLFLPTLIHFVGGAAPFPWGGAVGRLLSGWLIGFLGTAGTALLLLFVPVAVGMATVNRWWTLPQRKKAEEALPAETEEAGTAQTDDSTLPSGPEMILLERPAASATLSQPIRTQEPIDEDRSGDAEERLHVPEMRHVERSEEESVAADPELTIVEPVDEAVSHTGSLPETEYDPTLDLSGYEFPPLDLLEQHGNDKPRVDAEELMQNKDQIVNTLRNYGIEIQSIKATVGPTVTLYEIVPAPGIRISKIKNLEDDIALSLAALGIRIIAPIPGRGTIGIEVPNANKEIVSMRTLLASEKFQHAGMELPIALGKTIGNEIFLADLARMPHLLMAGATGQGKSVGINAILISLLYKKHPSQVKFVLIDPKKVELSLYSAIEHHYLAKLPGHEEAIIMDTRKVVHTLKALTIEMELRYDLLKEAQCRNVKEYNAKFVRRQLNPQKGHRFLPYIVLVIDEFADLIMTAGKEIETPITRLAQLARAIGIHLIIATQRPSVNIITGTIKANFPARMAFKVTSKVDSRTILDQGGAEQLIGRGDMLLSLGSDLLRLQCGFVDTPEVERICAFIASQRGYPQPHLLPEVKDENDDDTDLNDLSQRDELFEEAARLVVQYQQGSTSLIQRRLKLGYNRAGRLMDQLESAGIVGPNQGSKARDVLIHSEMELEQYLSSLAEGKG